MLNIIYLSSNIFKNLQKNLLFTSNLIQENKEKLHEKWIKPER